MDRFIVVIEPGARSVQTYEKVKQLAADLGVTKVDVVANKIRDDADREFVRSRIPEENLLGFISYDAEVIDADRRGLSPYDVSPCLLYTSSMGPCRITPKAPRGICGCDVHGIVGRNYLRFTAGGSATHSDHGREIMHTLYQTREGGNYQVKDPDKLIRIAKELSLIHI